VAAAVEVFHPLDDLFRSTGDDKRQQRFQKRDNRHRRRKELRRIDCRHERMFRADHDGRGRAVGNADDRHALLACHLHCLDDLCAIRLRGHGDQHVAAVGPGKVVNGRGAGARNGVKLLHAGGGQVGKVAGVGIVDADTQHKHLARSPDGLCRCLEPALIDAGKRLLDVAQGRVDHVGIKPAQFPARTQALQPARPVGKAGRATADFLAERLAEIIVAFKAQHPRHAHQRVGLHVSGCCNLAHRADAHLVGVFQHERPPPCAVRA
jgi:hypothetical protein